MQHNRRLVDRSVTHKRRFHLLWMRKTTKQKQNQPNFKHDTNLAKLDSKVVIDPRAPCNGLATHAVNADGRMLTDRTAVNAVDGTAVALWTGQP